MGGLIHSKGGSAGFEARPADRRARTADPMAIAVERGLRMRHRAETLADLFAERDPGHLLLDRLQPAARQPGRADVRRRSDLPLGQQAQRLGERLLDDASLVRRRSHNTEASDPAWYYGDPDPAAGGRGHEIESHSFGHLYVRGTTPDELTLILRSGTTPRGRWACRRCAPSPSPGGRAIACARPISSGWSRPA